MYNHIICGYEIPKCAISFFKHDYNNEVPTI